MTGGVSHMDTFDPKPYLNQNHNKKTGKGNRFYKGADWAFRRHGQSGTEVSDLFPHIGGMMDDICIIRSMKNINGDHFGGGCSSPAAVAGYPHITVPAGFIHDLPVGISFFASAWQEPALIKFAYAFEQGTRARRAPKYLERIAAEG